MDNHDKLFNQIKSAAENAETKDFPGMEKVWSRIDAKLDAKVEKKQSNNWKKLVIAASIVLLFSIGYQFVKENKQIIIPRKEVVKDDTKGKLITPKLQTDTTAIATTNPLIKKEATAILSKQINSQNQVSLNYNVAKTEESSSLAKDTVLEFNNNKSMYNMATTNATSTFYKGRKFESKSVEKNAADMDFSYSAAKEDSKAKKIAPIVVVDGELSKESLSTLDNEDVESIIELKEPLYIINGIYYTEKELFGPNPTSPYAPLNKQKIETISILQPEKAVTIYGEKGKKGIVIITTKEGKPVPQKKE